MIKFVEITNNNIADVISLSVHDNQKEFVADNAISLVEAYATRNEETDIMCGAEIVALFKI